MQAAAAGPRAARALRPVAHGPGQLLAVQPASCLRACSLAHDGQEMQAAAAAPRAARPLRPAAHAPPQRRGEATNESPHLALNRFSH